MSMFLRSLLAACITLSALTLFGCGTAGVERVDVTWDTDPPPRWGLYPGYRQEIPCPRGATYRVDVYRKGKSFTGGAVAESGNGLAFRPSAGARDIEADTPAMGRMLIYVTLRDEKGASTRQLALRVERQGDKIVFEFPK